MSRVTLAAVHKQVMFVVLGRNELAVFVNENGHEG